MFSSTLYAQNINVTNGWQLLGATEDINISSFNNKCVNHIWKYDTTNTTSPQWQIHISNGINYTYNYDEILSINKGEGFWIYGNDFCNIITSIYPNLTLGDYDVTNIMDQLEFDFNSFNIFDKFKNMGIGFDLSNLDTDVSMTSDLKYKFSFGSLKYLEMSLNGLEISIVDKNVTIQNLENLLNTQDEYSVNIKTNITDTNIDEIINIDKRLLNISSNQQLQLNILQLIDSIKLQISQLENFDLNIITSMLQEDNKSVNFALGFRNTTISPNDIEFGFQDLTNWLGTGYKGYVISIDNNQIEKIFNIISIDTINSTLPIDIEDFNISNLDDFNISKYLLNINIDLLSKLNNDFNSTITSKTKILMDDVKYVILTSDSIDIQANKTNGLMPPDLNDKNVTLSTNLTIPVTVFGITLDVAIPDTKIPLSDFISTDNGKLDLDINKVLELLKGTNSTDESISNAYKQVVDKINQEIQDANKVELINGFNFVNTAPNEIQTIFDSIILELDDSNFDGFKGIKTRIK